MSTENHDSVTISYFTNLKVQNINKASVHTNICNDIPVNSLAIHGRLI